MDSSSISRENRSRFQSSANKNNKNPNSSRRTASFSSLSSSSSSSFSPTSSTSLRSMLYFPEDSPLGPATPLRFTGVPFSWEKLPGIPKNNNTNNLILKRKDSILKKKLPLPPLVAPSSTKLHRFDQEIPTRKKSPADSFRKDPFIAALVECSKGDDDRHHHDERDDDDHHGNYWSGPKVVSRSISGRFGFINLYTSCKRSCAVSESLVYLPRPTRTSSSYDLLNRRRSR